MVYYQAFTLCPKFYYFFVFINQHFDLDEIFLTFYLRGSDFVCAYAYLCIYGYMCMCKQSLSSGTVHLFCWDKVSHWPGTHLIG